MEGFREHVYSLRRLLICGTAQQRSSLLSDYLQAR
jgi:hypothetical protein